jgi:site-specific recombinase
MLPIGLGMCVELAVYGLVSGLLGQYLPKRLGRVARTYVALLGAMAAGRLVWGAAAVGIYAATGGAFTWTSFAQGAVTHALPGIVLQIVALPLIVIAVRRGQAARAERRATPGDVRA